MKPTSLVSSLLLVSGAWTLPGCNRQRLLVLAPTQSVNTIVTQSKGIDEDDLPVTTKLRDLEVVASAYGSPPIHFPRADVYGVFVGGYLSDLGVATVSRDATWEGVYALWADMVAKLQSHGFETDEPLPTSAAELQATLPAAIEASGGMRMYFHGKKRASATLSGGLFITESAGATVSVSFYGPMYYLDWVGEAPRIRWPPDGPSP